MPHKATWTVNVCRHRAKEEKFGPFSTENGLDNEFLRYFLLGAKKARNIYILTAKYYDTFIEIIPQY